MIKVTTKNGNEYTYVGAAMKDDTEAVQMLAELKEKGYAGDMVAISLRMMMKERKDDKV